MKHFISRAGLIFFLAAAMCVSALAASGSITVTVTDCNTAEAIGGGKIALYKAADVNAEMDGFVYTDAFAGCPVELPASTASAAVKLAEWAKDITPDYTCDVGDDGKAVFTGLSDGLYLVVQTEAKSGYELINPFTVSMPLYEDGAYTRDIDASPKGGEAVPKETVSTHTSGGTTYTGSGSRRSSTGGPGFDEPEETETEGSGIIDVFEEPENVPGESDGSKTGDDSMAVPAVIALIICAGALAVVLRKRTEGRA